MAMAPGRLKRANSYDLDLNKRRSNSVYSNVSTGNRFSVLDSNVSSGGAKRKNVKGNSGSNNAASGEKRPPIIITDSNCAVEKVVSDLNIKFNLKLIGIGTKVFLENKTDSEKLEQFLVKNKIEFFSHPTKNQKPFRVILSGLPELPISVITDHLKQNNNLTPLGVSILGGNQFGKLYLLNFDKRVVNWSDLNNIRAVCNHIIKWLPFRSRKRGPTQCLNCGMFGHGISYCRRLTRCLRCGENHDTKSCNFTEANDHVVFKCVNCSSKGLQSNHRGDDANCPQRKNYIEIKQSVNSGKKPPVYNTRSANHKQLYTSNSSEIVTQASYSEVLKNNAAPECRQRSSNDNSNDDNLWSIVEVSNIIINSINDLKKCGSKLDQLKIIASLLKDACG